MAPNGLTGIGSEHKVSQHMLELKVQGSNGDTPTKGFKPMTFRTPVPNLLLTATVGHQTEGRRRPPAPWLGPVMIALAPQDPHH